MTYYDISTSIQRSCKTYGKLRLQLAAPPLHGRDRHIEGNHLPGQGLLQMEVMFGSQGHTLDISVASNLTSEHLELVACKSPQTSKLKNLFLESRPFHISDRNNPDKLTLLYFYII